MSATLDELQRQLWEISGKLDALIKAEIEAVGIIREMRDSQPLLKACPALSLGDTETAARIVDDELDKTVTEIERELAGRSAR